MPDLDANKDLVRRFYAEVINGRNVDAIDQLLTEDFVHNGEPRGRSGQKKAVRVFLDAFDPLTNEIVVLIAQGEMVAAHQHWAGRQVGEFNGVAATGRSITFVSTAILRVRDREIAEAIDVVGLAQLMTQLTASC